MPLILLPVDEKDLSDIAKIQSAAFTASSPEFENLLHPNGRTNAIIASDIDALRKRFANPNVVFLKVVDTDLSSQAVAFAIWRITREDEPIAETRPPPTISKPEQDDNGDINHALFTAFLNWGMPGKQQLIAGRKRVDLTFLCTLPEHQRRGAGKMLLQKGTEIANQEGLDSWVVASSAGLPLYKSVGFEEVEGGTFELDLRPFGMDETFVHKVMTRPLNKA